MPQVTEQESFAFALRLSKRKIRRADVLIPPPPFEVVGEIASELVKELSAAGVDFHEIDSISQARITGWLLPAIDHYGCGFEDIVDHSNFSVAMNVAQVSYDLRLSYPRRVLARCSAVGTAKLMAQLPLFASILAQTEILKAAAKTRLSATERTNISLWVTEHTELLNAFNEVRNIPLLWGMVTDVRHVLQRLFK